MEHCEAEHCDVLKNTPIKGVLFDKDGTLFGFSAMWALWCDRVLAELSAGDDSLGSRLGAAVGYDTQHRQFAAEALIVKAAASEINQAWCNLLPNSSFASIEAIGHRHLQALPAAVPVTDLDKLCQTLKVNGIKLGVATNDFEAVACDQLKQVGATAHFDFICGFDSGFGAKPQAGMILAFCEQTGLDPSAVAMVGDSSHDLEAGRAAGAGLLVGVLTGPAKKADLELLADVVLDDISDLPQYLGFDR